MLLLLVIVILIVFGIRKQNTDVDYMSYNQTMVIRGAFYRYYYAILTMKDSSLNENDTFI